MLFRLLFTLVGICAAVRQSQVAKEVTKVDETKDAKWGGGGPAMTWWCECNSKRNYNYQSEARCNDDCGRSCKCVHGNLY
mmetsp:Transcript_64401/g.153757  ORF Transcript_64401/g.153757 Transcript_64401/m.153757 type:complete len:80 (+) Transcript_64401:73-312(+)|eukprot:CAMPEP_0181428290 /NCGR_PEP_ID=MMETSP1110-20121109/16603_1 /TAXON_ID=174948 /ORGANISM="Symbiodinium sp., Strain CCMP421" /LENGTH=79 /DNA_ID=CAMNT_0023551513 /DNA_START=50 /DNA_END=289 /DNA_ORIENTATION=-